MAAPPKLVSPRKKPIDPEVKIWIDNVIVPTLVREFLASEKKCRESSYDAPMVPYPVVKASSEEER